MNLDDLRRSLGTGTDEETLGTVAELEPSCQSIEQARAYLWAIVSQLLRANRLIAVATLLWGHDIFDARPESVRRIFHAIESEAKLILLGCGSAGKTYTTACWFLLDWLKDPLYTNSKIISTSAGHAKANVFSTLNMLHEASIIKLPGELLDGWIGCNSKNRHAGISRVSIPAGATGRAALQGYHPLPRSSVDPLYGAVGRCRCFVDEAEEVPGGVFLGLNNMLLSMHGTDLIKVIAACNPRNVLSPLAIQAQPTQGWNRVLPDKDHDWRSKERWRVVRIDAPYHLENVREQKMIYHGFMSFEGYENLRLLAGGGSPEYWTMGRGLYPLEGVQNVVIPISLLDNVFGQLVFVGRAVPVGAVDLAFEGQDLVVFTAARYGLCSGFRHSSSKDVIPFDSPRYCLQIDQQFTMTKMRTLQLAEEIMNLCERLGIDPDWMMVDRTGVGVGVHDALLAMWSPLVHGVNWGESATETKILEEDSHKAIEEMDGIDSEMFMCLRRWIEYDHLKISPTMNSEQFVKGVTQRIYYLTSKGPTGLGRVAVESKKEFKKRYGWSPDHADSAVMCLHMARKNGAEKAKMALHKRWKPKMTPKLGVIERTQFVPFSPNLDR